MGTRDRKPRSSVARLLLEIPTNDSKAAAMNVVIALGGVEEQNQRELSKT